MNATLAVWNTAQQTEALETMLACCGSKRWAEAMVAQRPFANVRGLSEAADRLWTTVQEADWLEAFACHPRIGERQPTLLVSRPSYAAARRSAAWSHQEQSSANAANELLLAELAEDNQRYEQRFGFTYIICATGKSAAEMLTILKQRLARDRETELREAAEQQRQIMQIRLGKWLAE